MFKTITLALVLLFSVSTSDCLSQETDGRLLDKIVRDLEKKSRMTESRFVDLAKSISESREAQKESRQERAELRKSTDKLDKNQRVFDGVLAGLGKKLTVFAAWLAAAVAILAVTLIGAILVGAWAYAKVKKGIGL